MKNLLIAGSCLVLLITSCKKSNDSSTSSPPTGALIRVQQGTDANIAKDTVFLIKYNSANKIASITDSLLHDTLVAQYDAGNKLSSVHSTRNINATYTWDANGLLTQLNYTYGSDSERYTFEYTNGVMSRKNYYINLGSGTYTLMGYNTYIVLGGNINRVNAHAADGTLEYTLTYTYGTQSNTFKDLGLFNYGGHLGSDDIIDIDTWFNTNLRATISKDDGSLISNTYTLADKQQVAKAVSSNVTYGDVFTWMFTYQP